MQSEPLVIERTYNAPIEKVWKAITDKDQMKQWYFDLKEFRAEKGFRFSFMGGDDCVQYLHVCEVLAVDAPHRLSYSWTYPEHNDGYSVVTFELFKEGEKKTRVRLSHEGLDSFPKDQPNFAIGSFTEGWNSILGDSLKQFVETDIIRKSVVIKASAEAIWKIVLNPNNTWGMTFGDGALVQATWQPGTEVVWTDLKGDIGARGIVKEHKENHYLQVDMYDDVHPAPGAEVGEYSEKFTLTGDEQSGFVLHAEGGPLPKKYVEGHGKMWDTALDMIKKQAEETVLPEGA